MREVSQRKDFREGKSVTKKRKRGRSIRLSPKENVIQWYIWAGRELHYDYKTVDDMDIDDFFDMVLVYDKVQNPDDYIPAEEIFKP